MKKHLKEYTDHLEATIGEYMERPVSERSAEAVDSMTECWKHLKEAEKMIAECGTYADFTAEDAEAWAKKLVNDDENRTTGPHWTIDQTTKVAERNNVYFEHITKHDFWITMNMMYSDYSSVADKYGVNTADFFADMSKAFLFDKDGPKPEEKLAAYYHGIVCRNKNQE